MPAHGRAPVLRGPCIETPEDGVATEFERDFDPVGAQSASRLDRPGRSHLAEPMGYEVQPPSDRQSLDPRAAALAPALDLLGSFEVLDYGALDQQDVLEDLEPRPTLLGPGSERLA